MMGTPAASALALFASVFAVAALAQQLPDDPARKVLLEACVQCHDLSPIVTQGKDAQAWGRTVDEMIWRGAPLYTGERELVTRYLAEFFREPLANNKAVSAAAPDEKESLPPGAGREILVSACVACHDLSVILAPRKSEVEWRHTIDHSSTNIQSPIFFGVPIFNF